MDPRDRSPLAAHQAELAPMAIQFGDDGGETPEWLHLVPSGPVVEGRDGRAFRVEDHEAILRATAAELPMLVDWDHEAMWGSTKAAAWIDRVEYVEEPDDVRTAPGYWGHVETWTPEGADDVRHRRYRMISPVIRQRPAGDEPGEAPQMLAIENVALTNRPNLRMVSINAEGAPEGAEEQAMTEEELATLLSLLGLEEGASGADILAAVEALVGSAGDGEGEDSGSDEANSLRAALRVSEAALEQARARIAELESAQHAAEIEARRALVDEAIAEGRALEAHREELTVLATSERAEDREMFERLTAHRVAPRGRVAGSGEVRGGPDGSDPGMALAAMSEEERLLYVNFTRGLGMSHERAMSKIRGRA